MFTVFEEYLSERITLTYEDISLIQSLSIEKELTKQEFIIREGETCLYMIFVIKGLLKLCKATENDNEYILKFANEYHWINDRESYLTGKPSHFNITAIENTKVLMWKKKDFDYLLLQIPAFKELMKGLSIKNQIFNQKRIYNTLSCSSGEQYHEFTQNYPDIFNRVPLHMVASYLGVTCKTLSRIRSKSLQK